ncbi:S-layer homology domain-containing protein [Oscillospiraceae bacterium OttesenSCG-928-G22]|nr:S-layer homology domain-containing protein [Oscillospiraceae bacterium OttesenSCG-928-G22]
MTTFRKRALSCFLVFCILFALTPQFAPRASADWDGTTVTAFTSGSGTATDPYLIENEGHLAHLAQQTNLGNISAGTYFVQAADLALDSKEWTPIGTVSNPFEGNYDGQGHKITNLSITTYAEDVGLFGRVNAGAIENVHVSGTISVVTGGGFCAGGLIGNLFGSSATVRHCSANVTVTVSGTSGTTYAGGLIGYFTSGTVYGCYAQGDVTISGVTNASAGGFAGGSSSGVAATAAFGDISATATDSAYAGGFIASMASSASATACYALKTATVSDATTRSAGGFAGISYSSNVTNSYCTMTTPVGNGSVSGITVEAAANMKLADFAVTLNSHMPTDNTRKASWILSGTDVIPVHPFFTSGTGADAANAYLIENESQLRALAEYVNTLNDHATSGKYFKLGGDIALTGGEWIPIGNSRESVAFQGIFDGQNYTVSGLSITKNNCGYLGLFGRVQKGTGAAGISNLNVSGTINVSGSNVPLNAGLLAGYISGILAITDCATSGTVTVASSNTVFVGGISSYLGAGAAMSECYSTADVTAQGTPEATVGGLIGALGGAVTITDAFSTGDVSASATGTADIRVGGIWGNNIGSPGNMTRVYTTGNISGSGTAGNIRVGGIGGAYAGSTISEAWSSGNLSGTGADSVYLGGIVARLFTGTVGNSNYYASDALQTIHGTDQNPKLGVGYGTDGATAIARAGMQGLDALTNMSNLTGANWVAKENTATELYFPQLAVFATDGTDAQKAASLASVSSILPPPQSGGGGTTVQKLPAGSIQTPYTKDGNVVLITPTDTELGHMTPNSDGVCLVDASKVTGAVGIRFTLPAAWFDHTGDVFELLLPSGKYVRFGDAIIPPGSLITSDTVTISLLDGSAIVTVKKNNAVYTLNAFENPLTVGIPYTLSSGENANHLVMFDDRGTEEPMHLIPRSWYADGYVHAKVYSSGDYDVINMGLSGFEDIKGLWMERPANYIACRGVTTGVEQGRFDYDGHVTRAQFITMLMRLLDVELTGAWMPAPWNDQREIPDWALASMMKATAMGLLKGDENGNCRPNDAVSRQDMFTLAYRAMELMNMIEPTAGGVGLGKFSDRDAVSDYAQAAMGSLADIGLVNGADGRVSPHNTAKRCDAAQFLYNLLRYDAK